MRRMSTAEASGTYGHVEGVVRHEWLSTIDLALGFCGVSAQDLRPLVQPDN